MIKLKDSNHQEQMPQIEIKPYQYLKKKKMKNKEKKNQGGNVKFLLKKFQAQRNRTNI